MKNVIKNYLINENTMALLPVAHIDYQTLVVEKKISFYVSKTPLQLIREACLEGGSTLEGRKKAVATRTNCKHKVPIPIQPFRNIYAFPTHSPTHFSCSWIFSNHVKAIGKNPSKPNQSMIFFKNNQQLELPVSYYMVEKQMNRTAMCMILFSEMRCS